MAYQQCANDVINILQNKYPTKSWAKIREDKIIIFNSLMSNLGVKCLCLDVDIIRKTYNQIYKGLTITNYIVPIMDIDIDPSLRECNEYNKDYDECIIEEENNHFKFNLL